MQASAIESAKTSAMNAAKAIYQEYKLPIWLIGSYVLGTMVLSNISNIKTLRNA
jgi:hypothetical protein